MRNSIASALILALLLVNALAWQGWFQSDRQMRQWRDLAISENTVILQQEQALGGNADTMDRCFERIFK